MVWVICGHLEKRVHFGAVFIERQMKFCFYRSLGLDEPSEQAFHLNKKKLVRKLVVNCAYQRTPG